MWQRCSVQPALFVSLFCPLHYKSLDFVLSFVKNVRNFFRAPIRGFYFQTPTLPIFFMWFIPKRISRLKILFCFILELSFLHVCLIRLIWNGVECESNRKLNNWYIAKIAMKSYASQIITEWRTYFSRYTTFDWCSINRNLISFSSELSGFYMNLRHWFQFSVRTIY